MCGVCCTLSTVLGHPLGDRVSGPPLACAALWGTVPEALNLFFAVIPSAYFH